MGFTFASLVAFLLGILQQLVFVLATAATVLFMWAGFRYVYNAQSGKRSTGARTTLLWSLVALFVLFSIWGILRVMCNSFLSEGECGGAGQPTNIVPVGASGTTDSSGFQQGNFGGTSGGLGQPIY